MVRGSPHHSKHSPLCRGCCGGDGRWAWGPGKRASPTGGRWPRGVGDRWGGRSRGQKGDSSCGLGACRGAWKGFWLGAPEWGQQAGRLRRQVDHTGSLSRRRWGGAWTWRCRLRIGALGGSGACRRQGEGQGRQSQRRSVRCRVCGGTLLGSVAPRKPSFCPRGQVLSRDCRTKLRGWTQGQRGPTASQQPWSLLTSRPGAAGRCRGPLRGQWAGQVTPRTAFLFHRPLGHLERRAPLPRLGGASGGAVGAGDRVPFGAEGAPWV